MAQKKDRSRFSIKFRENDPAHERTICILESQGQRNIAPFLVNAVLHYVQCSETPNMSCMLTEKPQPVMDKSDIEDVVKEILRQQGIIKGEARSEIQVNSKMEGFLEGRQDLHKAEDNLNAHISSQNLVNEDMRAMITRTLAAFRDEK